jgi:exodeoxyribonuclease VII large subunit
VEQIGLEWKPWQPEKLSVKQITSKLKRTLREGFSNLYVTGEVSGLKQATSGHLYFNLKEEDTVLPCAMYRQNSRLLRAPLRDGMMIEARGSIDVYEPRGSYQFIVESASPVGIGALQQAFEALKKKLAAEGLFEASRKRELPRFPRRIGIVTSPTGAVIQDMLNVFNRRSRGLEIRLYPSLVQGTGSAEQLCEGLEYFSSSGWPDVVIIARGGGSLEDLWSFNEESVARAIVNCSVPVVSAVGHETDFTIADFVADLRAPTPSAAAEMIAPDVEALLERLSVLDRAMQRSIQFLLTQYRERVFRQGIDKAQALIQRRLNQASQRIDEADSRIDAGVKLRFWSLKLKWQKHTLELFALDRRMIFMDRRGKILASQVAMQNRIKAIVSAYSLRLESLEGQLRQLNPTRILDRGFALVQTEEGKLVRSPRDIRKGATMTVRVAKGSFEAVKK